MNQVGVCEYALSSNDMIEVVVARYREDIGWCSSLGACQLTVYDKDPYKTPLPSELSQTTKRVFLPNIGREAHTYMIHIVSNYYNLAKKIVFLQGSPFEHINRSTTNLVNSLDSTLPFENLCRRIDYHDLNDPKKGVVRQEFESYFATPITTGIVEHGFGAQFAVTRECIQSRPYEFYVRLLADCFKNETHYAYMTERLWPYIFNPEFKLKDNVA